MYRRAIYGKPFKIENIPLGKILLGGENDLPGYKYSLITGDYMRPSTRAIDGPHSRFLADYLRDGPSVFDRLETSEYYENARQCIVLFGEYFPGIDQDSAITLAARRFVGLDTGEDISHLPSAGHSADGELIELVPIQDSDCYQLRQGNHRVAFAHASGQSHITAKVLHKRSETTPI